MVYIATATYSNTRKYGSVPVAAANSPHLADHKVRTFIEAITQARGLDPDLWTVQNARLVKILED